MKIFEGLISRWRISNLCRWSSPAACNEKTRMVSHTMKGNKQYTQFPKLLWPTIVAVTSVALGHPPRIHQQLWRDGIPEESQVLWPLMMQTYHENGSHLAPILTGKIPAPLIWSRSVCTAQRSRKSLKTFSVKKCSLLQNVPTYLLGLAKLYPVSLCWIWHEVIVDISKLGQLTELGKNEIPWNRENTTDFLD